MTTAVEASAPLLASSVGVGGRRNSGTANHRTNANSRDLSPQIRAMTRSLTHLVIQRRRHVNPQTRGHTRQSDRRASTQHLATISTSTTSTMPRTISGPNPKSGQTHKRNSQKRCHKNTRPRTNQTQGRSSRRTITNGARGHQCGAVHGSAARKTATGTSRQNPAICQNCTTKNGRNCRGSPARLPRNLRSRPSRAHQRCFPQ